MKLIKYNVVQSTIGEEDILVCKKVGYSEANLAIAVKEAYDGYEIIEDDVKIVVGENLLVNSNFLNPVNLRKEMKSKINSPFINEWRTDNFEDGICYLTNSCIQINNNSSKCDSGSENNIALYQILSEETIDLVLGKTVTFSITTVRDEVISLTVDIPESFQERPSNVIIGKIEYETYILYVFNKAYSSKAISVGINPVYKGGYSSCTIKNVKLEIGSVATKYVPKTYEEELLACCSKPLVISAGSELKKEITDTGCGDEVLDAILRKRQILVQTPNADGTSYTKILSPVYMYQLPNYQNDYLYLFYLRDEKQTLDLSTMGMGTVQLPVYGQVQLKLSKEYTECPIRNYY